MWYRNVSLSEGDDHKGRKGFEQLAERSRKSGLRGRLKRSLPWAHVS